MNTHPAVEAVISLQPLIREHLAEGEQRARLSQEVVTAVGKAGLFRLYAPREVGGLEASPSVVFAAAEAASAADPAVGWYMGNSTAACLTAAYLGERERADLFAEPDRHFGFSAAVSGKAIPCDGGYRVSGQWPLVTGCEDAAWCALSGLVMDGDTPRQVNGQPDGRLFFIKTADLIVSPTWQQASAMRGTASNAASTQDVFIPEGMAHAPTKPLVIDRPLYHVPISTLFVAFNMAVVLGVLATALATAQEELSTKVSSINGYALRDEVPIQELVATSRATLRGVRAGICELTDELEELIATGAEVPIPLRADIYAYYYYTLDSARETISQLYARGTRAGFIQGNPMERALRNLHALSMGSEAARPFQHDAGRVLLGGEPTHPAF